MILKKTFRGGVHPSETMPGKSVTGNLAVADAAPPRQVAILLGQSAGAPCRPLVKPGERVLRGQKIGEPSGFVGAPVHASVSGKVLGIQQRVNAAGLPGQAVVIESDGLDEWAPPMQGAGSPRATDPKLLLSLIREAGIVGLGGAAFPTQVKLSPPGDKHIDTVICNGAECEPYLTSDHRTMLERAEDVLEGLLIAREILGAQRAFIGIEANKPDAISKIDQAAQGKDVTVCQLPVKYPQGGEKQLIQVITGRQVPSGKLPMDAGCVVINVSTAVAIADAVLRGRPITQRVVTVTGAIDHPQNLRARVGTPVGELIEQCGGLRQGVNKVVLGGPMMGLAACSLDTPVVKGTSGILLIKDDSKLDQPRQNCIRCARCAGACPIYLMPMQLYALSTRDRHEEAKAIHAMDCIECGACSFICPARLPLTQAIRVTKREITRTAKR